MGIVKSKENRKKVLIVDDDSKMRRILSEFLKKNYNVEIVETGNGLDAINETLKCKFDIVFSDLEMPEMTGLEFMGYLKTKSEFDDIPKFLLTSRTKKYFREKAKKVGVDKYLSKPLNLSDIKNALSDIF